MNDVLAKFTRLFFAAFLALCLAVMAAGCGGDKKSKTDTNAEGKEPPTTANKPVPTTPPGASTSVEMESEEPSVQEEVYSYSVKRKDGKPKRDPFRPIIVKQQSPVMRYDISQMGVNGVIIHGVKTANVMTPDGTTTRVQIGDPIGINDGEVVDISLEGLRVKEKYLDVNGRIQEYYRYIYNKPYSVKKK